jgi:hypothetical protein
VDGQWRRGSLWDILDDLPCAECGRLLHPGDLVVRGLGLPPDRQQDLLCTASCRPFHLSRPPEPDWDLGGLLTRGVPIGFDPECRECRDERRQDERERAREELRAASPERASLTGGPGSPTSPTWQLLVYTLSAEASPQRAATWRELKRAGAVPLRDGVCVLPEDETATAALVAIASRVEAAGGQATLVRGGRLSPEDAQRVEGQLREERRAEYREVAASAERLLERIQRQHEEGGFRFSEQERLEAELGSLRSWVDRIRARDPLGVADTEAIDDELRRCEEALATIEAEATDLP